MKHNKGLAKLKTEYVPQLGTTCIFWTDASCANDNVQDCHILEVEAPQCCAVRYWPAQITVHNRNYIRYCGLYYVSTDLKEKNFSLFWDFIGSDLDIMTNSETHHKVYSLFIEHLDVSGTHLKIIDFGVGTGSHTKSLLAATDSCEIELYGADISEEMVDVAMHNGVRAKKIVDGRIPFPGCYFDVLVSCFVMHLYDKDFRPFPEWFRILKHSGKAVFNHPPFQDYSPLLLATGFTSIKTTNTTISSLTKDLDIWITSATKP